MKCWAGKNNMVNFKGNYVHLNKPNKYKCELCNEKFRLKYSLVEHMAKKHKIKTKWKE